MLNSKDKYYRLIIIDKIRNKLCQSNKHNKIFITSIRKQCSEQKKRLLIIVITVVVAILI